MRKLCYLILLWSLSALHPANGQKQNDIENLAEAPVESTQNDTTWYYLMSAAVQSVPGDNSGIGAAYFPMYERNIVLCNRSKTESRYTARDAQFTAEEHFALVRRNGEFRLVNRSTGGYMTGSWGSDANGEPLKCQLISGTKNQYLVSTGGRSPLWLKYNEGLIADRYRYDNFGSANAGKTTAWYFVPAKDAQVQFVMRKQQARHLIATLKRGTNPGEYANSGSLDALKAALAEAEKQESVDANLLSAIEDAVKNVKNDIIRPSVGETYLIRSASSPYDNRGYYLYTDEEGIPVSSNEDEYLSLNYVWEIASHNGKNVLINKGNGKQIQPKHTLNTAFTTDSKDVPVSFTYLGDQQWNISSEGIIYHRSNVADHLLYNWAGGAGTASAWYIKSISDEELNEAVTLTKVNMIQARTSTGIGNKKVPLVGIRLKTKGFIGEESIASLTFSTKGTTDRNVVRNYQLYHAQNARRLLEKNRIEITITENADGSLTVVPSKPILLNQGETCLWLTADISETAAEGQQLSYRLISCTDTKDKEHLPTSDTTLYPTTIFLGQSTVLACGEYGSKYYRIPAIATADDGSLIAVTDRRIHSNVDLPAHIDVYVNRSTDNGSTWSEPVMVAGDEPGTIGYGDAAIIKNKKGRLIILYNGGRRGLWDSTAEEPFRKYKVWSDDNGITWSHPVDITDQLYGAGCDDPIARKWTAMLLTSGRGICTRDGVLMVAVAAKVPGKNGFSNYAAVSYDDGETWHTESAMTAWDAGDEAKLIELNNGDILISMRRGGGREMNTSPDKGKTWRAHYTEKELISPACNGEIIYYTSTIDGYNKNRILHSVPYANNRSNVSVLLSYDEGNTYPIRKTICPTASAYSALTILPDGTIGCYFEDGGAEMDMVFVRFSLKWLTDGKDEYTLPATGITQIPTECIHEENALYDYTLEGKRIEKALHGLYIMNGKKTYVR